MGRGSGRDLGARPSTADRASSRERWDRGGAASSGGLGGARPATRPATGPAERPGAAERPAGSTRPATGERPGIGERPGAGERPGGGESASNGDRGQEIKDNTAERQQQRQQSAEERREDWQQHQNERREDWQEYADDHYEEYGHGYWYGGNWHGYDDDDWAAFAAGAVLATGVVIAASTLAESSCTMSNVVVNGETYYRCGSNWYQKGIQGSDVVYIVVTKPAGY